MPLEALLEKAKTKLALQLNSINENDEALETLNRFKHEIDWVRDHYPELFAAADETNNLEEIRAIYQANYSGVEQAKKTLFQQHQELEHISTAQTVLNITSAPLPAHDVVPDIRPSNSLPLSKCWELYSQEMIDSGNWRASSEKEYARGKSLITEITNDPEIDSITKPIISELKTILIKLPANHKKFREFKGMSYREVAQANTDRKRLTAQTANKYLRQLKAVIGWSINQGYRKESPNPVTGMLFKENPDKQNTRHPFYLDDLKIIFTQPRFTDKQSPSKPHIFWVPILALYTGARITELCQLRVENILDNEEIPLIEITDSHPEQQLKNTHSKRAIPIHPELIRIGFIDYVNEIRSRNYDWLFPDITKGPDGRGHYPSKRFSEFKDNLNIKNIDRKTFHSFRHSLSYYLKNAHVVEAITDEITGHAPQGESYGRYGDTSLPQTMLETIELLPYPDVTTHLRWNGKIRIKKPHSKQNE